MKRLILTGCALAAATPAFAQAVLPPVAPPPGTIVVRDRDNTGASPSLTIAPGATGAETIQTNSAAGGNAEQPSRAIPQGSGGGGGNSR